MISIFPLSFESTPSGSSDLKRFVQWSMQSESDSNFFRSCKWMHIFKVSIVKEDIHFSSRCLPFKASWGSMSGIHCQNRGDVGSLFCDALSKIDLAWASGFAVDDAC